MRDAESAAAALRFDSHGAEREVTTLTDAELATLRSLAEGVLTGRPGARLNESAALAGLLGSDGSMVRAARKRLGDLARPVRALLFDKTPQNNWPLGWHQDRTIAVTARREMPDYGPWSVKAGVTHVEPPFSLIERMVTVRAFLDPCGDDNAPLLIAPGSHRCGRIAVADIAPTLARLGEQACVGPAGCLWVYASGILHASQAARRPSHRRVLHVDFSADVLPTPLEWLGV